MGRFIDLTGKTFGKLAVVRRNRKEGYKTFWDVRCACGTEKVIDGANLRSGQVKSCGCMRGRPKKSPEPLLNPVGRPRTDSADVSADAEEATVFPDVSFKAFKQELTLERICKQYGIRPSTAVKGLVENQEKPEDFIKFYATDMDALFEAFARISK